MNLITLIFISFVFSACASESIEDDDKLIKNELIEAARSDLKLSDEEYGKIKLRIENFPLDSSVIDLSKLWENKRDHDLFELLWWRQEVPKLRIAIVFLMSKNRDEGISSVPDFEIYAKRFDEKEAKARLSEIVRAKKLLKEYHNSGTDKPSSPE